MKIGLRLCTIAFSDKLDSGACSPRGMFAQSSPPARLNSKPRQRSQHSSIENEEGKALNQRRSCPPDGRHAHDRQTVIAYWALSPRKSSASASCARDSALAPAKNSTMDIAALRPSPIHNARHQRGSLSDLLAAACLQPTTMPQPNGNAQAAAAMTAVAAHPTTRSRTDAVNLPMAWCRDTTTIIAAMIGTATTPLMTALQNNA